MLMLMVYNNYAVLVRTLHEYLVVVVLSVLTRMGSLIIRDRVVRVYWGYAFTYYACTYT